MKILKSFSIVALIATISLVSCKKDRVCECTITQTENGNVQSFKASATFVDVSKRTAKDACVDTKEVDGAETTVKDCELK